MSVDYLPLFFHIKHKRCLVVGGGNVATRRALLLEKASAIIDVVAVKVCDELVTIATRSGGSVRFGEYLADDLHDKHLVIAATDDQALNQRVSDDAHRQCIPVNVVDDTALCSVIVPAIVDRSPVVVAVSSGGRAPILSRWLRARLESLIPAAYGRLAGFMGRFRAKVRNKLGSVDASRHFWDQVLQGPVAEKVLAGDEQGAENLLHQCIGDAKQQACSMGEVYLVGAGPGDPDLLTFKALRLMQQADVVLYDRLVNSDIVDLCRRDAKRCYVGKCRGEHHTEQAAINEQLLTLAQAGKRVVRLKGGDPFIFGRGGEEMQMLIENNIPFQIVPGITAALGCAAYAGIPLTHRDYAQSVRFVAGYVKDGHIEGVPWPSLVQGRQTLVFYMALHSLSTICGQLIAHGLAPNTPIAIIQQGTTPAQHVMIGCLATIPKILDNHTIQSPALLMVGEVVGMKIHEKSS